MSPSAPLPFLLAVLLLLLSASVSNSSTLTPKRVLVIGGSGRVGKQVVQKLLQRGIHTHVLQRPSSPPPTTPSTAPGQLQVFEGTVDSIEALLKASKDCDAVIAVHGPRPPRMSSLKDLFVLHPKHHPLNHPYHTNFLGTKNILTAMHINHIPHLVRLTGSLVDRSAFNPIVLLFNALLSLVIKWHELSERAIRASGVDYTIVRCPEIKNDPPLTSDVNNEIDRHLVFRPLYTQDAASVDSIIKSANPPPFYIAADGKKTKAKRFIPSGDVADLCVASIFEPKLKKATVFVSTAEGAGSKSWQQLIQQHPSSSLADMKAIVPRKHVLALATIYMSLMTGLVSLVTKGKIFAQVARFVKKIFVKM